MPNSARFFVVVVREMELGFDFSVLVLHIGCQNDIRRGSCCTSVVPNGSKGHILVLYAGFL